MERIVSGKQVDAVLVHTDALLLGMLRKQLMQTFWNAQLKLSGVVLHRIRKGNGEVILKSGL